MPTAKALPYLESHPAGGHLFWATSSQDLALTYLPVDGARTSQMLSSPCFKATSIRRGGHELLGYLARKRILRGILGPSGRWRWGLACTLVLFKPPLWILQDRFSILKQRMTATVPVGVPKS